MNEPVPPWRTFGDGPALPPPTGPTIPPAPPGQAPAVPPAPPGQAPDQARDLDWRRWLAPIAAAIGGLLTGGVVAAVVALAVVLPAADGVTVEGEPLEPPTRRPPATSGLAAASSVDEAVGDTAGILVDVAGAVARPGLHRLRHGGRVGDAIDAAGGFAPRADLEAVSTTLNLAQPLLDGAKVLVPALGRAGTPDRPAAADGRIDLNRASQSELESLPGIGPVTARKIIDARAERPFGTVRDLRSRGLVGESVYADIEGRVSAG